jgi:hypothetical protein
VPFSLPWPRATAGNASGTPIAAPCRGADKHPRVGLLSGFCSDGCAPQTHTASSGRCTPPSRALKDCSGSLCEAHSSSAIMASTIPPAWRYATHGPRHRVGGAGRSGAAAEPWGDVTVSTLTKVACGCMPTDGHDLIEAFDERRSAFHQIDMARGGHPADRHDRQPSHPGKLLPSSSFLKCRHDCPLEARCFLLADMPVPLSGPGLPHLAVPARRDGRECGLIVYIPRHRS